MILGFCSLRIDCAGCHNEFFTVIFSTLMLCYLSFLNLSLLWLSTSRAPTLSPRETLMAIRFSCRFLAVFLQIFYFPLRIVFLSLIRIFYEPTTLRISCDFQPKVLFGLPIHTFSCFIRKFFSCFAIILFPRLPAVPLVFLFRLPICKTVIVLSKVLFLIATIPSISLAQIKPELHFFLLKVTFLN